MTPPLRSFKTLDEFWPFYISQHMNRVNRRLHFIGTSFGLSCLALAAYTRLPVMLAAGLVGAYGFAWLGHFLFERNSPATFRYPWLSFQADLRMYVLFWRGAIEHEIIRLKKEIVRYR